jgi:hypothetical protein
MQLLGDPIGTAEQLVGALKDAGLNRMQRHGCRHDEGKP